VVVWGRLRGAELLVILAGWCWVGRCRAPTLTYATSAGAGSAGVVRAAVLAKGRAPS